MSDLAAARVSDEAWMALALAEAERAFVEGEVPVGAVLVDTETEKVVATSANRTNKERNGIRHCEFICLEAAPVPLPASLRLYVTVEPCIMCAAAYRLMGVRDVVFGCYNDRFGGCGSVMDVATSAAALPPLRVTGGVLEEPAVQLLKQFYARGNPNAPPAKRHRPLGCSICVGQSTVGGGMTCERACDHEHALATLRLELDRLRIDNFKLKLQLQRRDREEPRERSSDRETVSQAQAQAQSLPARLRAEAVRTLERQVEEERRLRHAAEKERDGVLATIRLIEQCELRRVDEELAVLSKMSSGN